VLGILSCWHCLDGIKENLDIGAWLKKYIINICNKNAKMEYKGVDESNSPADLLPNALDNGCQILRTLPAVYDICFCL